MQTERAVLQSVADITEVPTLIDWCEKKRCIALEYIAGENLCDVINNTKVLFAEKKDIINSLANWFSCLHSAFFKDGKTVLRGDSILRNFIVSDTRIIGVDFEEAILGDPLDDIGEICASILDTDPMFTNEKKELTEQFIQEYQSRVPWSIEGWQKTTKNALEKHECFREKVKTEESRKLANKYLH